MSFFDSFFSKKDKSGKAAKDRLKIAIQTDRFQLSPQDMEDMQKEILEVISKYYDVENIDIDSVIRLERVRVDKDGAPVNVLTANIPIKKRAG